MKTKEFWRYFKLNHNHSKSKMFRLLFVTFLVFGIFIASLIFISGQGSRANIAESEIKREKDFINGYRAEEVQFRKEHGNFAHLSARSKIETIQNELIQKTKDYQLDVTSIQSLPEADKNSLEFEMGFSGSWENTVKYIRQLQESAGLISIINCSMSPKPNAGNLVETKLKYKIYVE